MSYTKDDLLKWESQIAHKTHMSIDELEAGEEEGTLSSREKELLYTLKLIHFLWDLT